MPTQEAADPLIFGKTADFLREISVLPSPDATAITQAEARNVELTKPAGALGRLEELAIWYAGWRGDPKPDLQRPQTLVFAGNHGVAARGVSAYPTDVTAQMVANFEAGGAAINQLCNLHGAALTVIPLALDIPTADFTKTAAMTEDEFASALSAGWTAVDPDADCILLGEMGIGNTTSAAAIACALFDGRPEAWVGAGTGVTGDALRAKQETVKLGIARHADALVDPIEVLRRLGGRELAAIAGAIMRARQERIPVILDGFICCAAAAPLLKHARRALDHCVAAHRSAEAAHGRLLNEMNLKPVLDLDLRLGEGSGAAVALGVLKAALACHSGMATFAEAAVSGKT
ncbi:MAG: nicotinate-nucleotide--dimethylbenzimidazole phosphoribosyltransferase [Pseudomonadota bacterium]